MVCVYGTPTESDTRPPTANVSHEERKLSSSKSDENKKEINDGRVKPGHACANVS